MYAALWRALPGPAWVRSLILLALAILVVVVLFLWVFPHVEHYVPWNSNTVEEPVPGQ